MSFLDSDDEEERLNGHGRYIQMLLRKHGRKGPRFYRRGLTVGTPSSKKPLYCHAEQDVGLEKKSRPALPGFKTPMGDGGEGNLGGNAAGLCLQAKRIPERNTEAPEDPMRRAGQPRAVKSVTLQGRDPRFDVRSKSGEADALRGMTSLAPTSEGNSASKTVRSKYSEPRFQVR